MAKKLTCLLLSLVLALALTATAFAMETLNLLSIRVSDPGYLSIIAGTDYTAEADMNFSAFTENGDLDIANTLVLREGGTSWFIIMEYGNYQGNESHQKTANRVLKKISEMIDDKDEGALIRCDEKHTVTLEKSDALRKSLTVTHQPTNAKELANTVRATMDYIQNNAANLMPNVAVIIVTACPSSKVTDTMIEDIGNVLNTNNSVTTHIIVTAASSVYREDRVVGQKLIEKAKLTVGGTGYITEKLTEAEADYAVQNINDTERRKILMLLDPKAKKNLGHKLTIQQTTAGGKLMSVELDIPDGLYNIWESSMDQRTANGGSNGDGGGSTAPTPPPSIIYGGVGGENTWVNTDVYDFTNKNKGMSTELLVGLIAGGVLLALLAVLLILRLKKNKKSDTADTKIYASNAGRAAAAGTTVTLTGSNGQLLKGTMKNNMLTIGRNGAKAMLSVPNDGKLSGLHATLAKQGNAMLITDNGSTNGTKVNGNKIETGVPTALNQNDAVTLGSTTYTISWRG